MRGGSGEACLLNRYFSLQHSLSFPQSLQHESLRQYFFFNLKQMHFSFQNKYTEIL